MFVSQNCLTSCSCTRYGGCKADKRKSQFSTVVKKIIFISVWWFWIYEAWVDSIFRQLTGTNPLALDVNLSLIACRRTPRCCRRRDPASSSRGVATRFTRLQCRSAAGADSSAADALEFTRRHNVYRCSERKTSITINFVDYSLSLHWVFNKNTNVTDKLKYIFNSSVHSRLTHD